MTEVPVDSCQILVEIIPKLYGFSVGSVSEVVRGVNLTYSLTHSTADYFLRLYSADKSLLEINFEVSALLALDSASNLSFNVASPVAGVNNTYIHKIWGRPSVLFNALKGDPLDINDQCLSQFGSALVSLHQFSGWKQLKEIRFFDLDGLLAKSLNYGKYIPDRTTVLQRLRASLVDVCDLPIGFCHGDAWIGNALRSCDSISLFDFEDCFVGPALFDVATFSWWLWQTHPNDFSRLFRAFLAGYGRELTQSERAALPAFVVLKELKTVLLLAENNLLSSELWEKYKAKSAKLIADWSVPLSPNQL